MAGQHNPVNNESSSLRLLTSKQVCAFLQVSRMTLHRLVSAGSLPVIRIGRSVRFRAAAIEAYLRKTESV
jgi:excisionase family DNA binding protein